MRGIVFLLPIRTAVLRSSASLMVATRQGMEQQPIAEPLAPDAVLGVGEFLLP
jgi:hypothetical protein